MASATDKLVPVYIPYETFTGFIAHLKATAIPSRIDKSVMPPGMPSLTRGQVQSALKFLRLVDSAGNTTKSLRELVAAYETSGWNDSLSDLVRESYQDITSELDLDNATQHQLDERFKAAGVNGQMLLKSVRFYLATLSAAGLTYSPHLNARRRGAVSSRKKNAGPKPPTTKITQLKSDPAPATPEIKIPEGTQSYPLYFRGKASGMIVVPEDLSLADCKVIELQLAVLRAYAGEDE